MLQALQQGGGRIRAESVSQYLHNPNYRRSINFICVMILASKQHLVLRVKALTFLVFFSEIAIDQLKFPSDFMLISACVTAGSG